MNENIKSGNSIITTDIFDGSLNLDDSEMTNINPFTWDAAGTFNKTVGKYIGRGFPEIMSNGGFDVVIGNPP